MHAANSAIDIWFHRYRDGRDIEGRFDYNSWVESDKGRRLSASLDKDVVLAEGKNLESLKLVPSLQLHRLQGV